MISAQDIHNVTFEKAMRGYRTDEVDEYLAKLAQDIDDMAKEKADMEKKLYILAEKVDQYRNDEETLKTALLNAQRLGETVVYEAKQKAETIIYDATSKANQVKDEAAEKVAAEELALTQLKSEVARFKNDVLNLYKQHIEALSAIPGAEDRPEQKKAVKEAPPAREEPELVVQKSVKEAAKEEDAPAQNSAPANPFAADVAPEQADSAPMFDNYQGIRFDD